MIASLCHISRISLSNILGLIDTPIKQVGFKYSTADMRFDSDSCESVEVHTILCDVVVRPNGPCLVTRPCESTKNIFVRASSMESLLSKEIVYVIKSAIPMAASPAPRNRNIWSDKWIPVNRVEATSQAIATAPVP